MTPQAPTPPAPPINHDNNNTKNKTMDHDNNKNTTNKNVPSLTVSPTAPEFFLQFGAFSQTRGQDKSSQQ